MDRDLWGGVVLLGGLVLMALGWLGWLPKPIMDLLWPEDHE